MALSAPMNKNKARAVIIPSTLMHTLANIK